MAAETQRPRDATGGQARILIAMIAAGGGHRAAAGAIHAGLEAAFPGRFDVRVLDLMAAVGDVELDRRHKSTWSWLLRHPTWANVGQRAMETAVPASAMSWVQDRVLAAFSRHAADYVRNHGIDLVVCVHFMPLRALAAAAARGDVDVPVLGVDTELFDGNVLWAERRMDELMVATEPCRDQLAAHGVPASRLRVTGYPVHPRFLDADRDQAAARRRLALADERMTAVHVAGGEGIGGQLEAAVRTVVRERPDLQYVAICGGNEPLRERLAALARSATPGAVRVEGFVDNLHDWFVASDVVVGKAGPGVTTEALVLGRPMLHTSFAAANEKKNVDYCTRNRIGSYLPRPSELVDAIVELGRDRDALLRLQRRARERAPRVGTPAIARRVAARLGAGREVEDGAALREGAA